MSGIQMSSVINDVLIFLREELEYIVPNRTTPIRLFNRAQLEVAVKTECIQFDIAIKLDKHEIETGITSTVSANERSIGGVTADVTTADYYNGWLLKNITAQGEAFITDSVGAGGFQTFALSRKITDQVSGDVFDVEKLAKYIDMPWFVIRPYLQEGVHWDDDVLYPKSVTEIKTLYGTSNKNTKTGTPTIYAIENQRVLIYPQPTDDKIVRLAGHRRPADCVISISTSAGAVIGDTIIDSAIPLKPNDHYMGMEVLMTSGADAGSIRRISEYDAATNTFYFETPFASGIGTGEEYEILSPLAEEYRRVIEDFMKWQLLRHNDKFRRKAEYYEMQWREGFEALGVIKNRKSTANIGIGRGGHAAFRRGRGRVITS